MITPVQPVKKPLVNFNGRVLRNLLCWIKHKMMVYLYQGCGSGLILTGSGSNLSGKTGPDP